MEWVLLYDGDCPACSPLARAVDELQVPQLGTRSLGDPGIAARLRDAGLEVPTKPALVLLEGTRARLLTGLRMRLRLARLLGVRRSREIVRLAVMEAKARTERGLSRRTFLGAAGAAAGAAVVGSAVAGSPAAAAEPEPVPPAEASLRRALASTRLRQAEATFGPLDLAGAAEFTGGDEPVLAVGHQNSAVITMVGLAANQEPAVLSMRKLATPRSGPARQGVQFLMPEGQLICTAVAVDGQVVFEEPPDDPGADPRLRLPTWRVRCFIRCIGRSANWDCIENCFGCAFGGGWSRWYKCARCAACAGRSAVRCMRECF